MKLYTALSLFGLAAGALVLAAPMGCGSDSGSSSGSSGTTTGPSRTPPEKPTAGPSNTPARTFAVSELFLGETDRAKSPNVKDAWKEYGYNLDGLTTDKSSKNVCTRVGGADANKQEDGKEGTDNAFGRTILSFITGLVPTPSKSLNDSINSGSFTILFDITGLDDSPTQTATGLGGRLLIGGEVPTGTTPNLNDPNFDWPYRANPTITIADAYINNGTFVNGSGGTTVELSLFIQGVALTLKINKAIITFDHKPPNDIANGTIAGVIGTEELVSGIEKVAGRISEQLCGGSTLDTIKTTIRQASDILLDGSNREGVACDAISIGIGFSGKRIGPPKTIAVEGAVPPDPCAAPQDAGTD